jgi:hypothetical protein
VADEITRQEDLIRASSPRVKSGTLRFWGDWFGRPYDNIHHLVHCDVDGDLLRLYFNDDEVLCVWAPRGLEVSDQIFKIADAAKVRWDWYSHGKPKTEENRYFLEYTKTADGIDSSTNVDWYKPELKPSVMNSAVEIL